MSTYEHRAKGKNGHRRTATATRSPLITISPIRKPLFVTRTLKWPSSDASSRTQRLL
jgi:hypothetical protein